MQVLTYHRSPLVKMVTLANDGDYTDHELIRAAANHAGEVPFGEGRSLYGFKVTRYEEGYTVHLFTD